MPEELKSIGEDYQKLSKDGFDAAVRSFAEVNKGFQTLTAEMTDYSKRVRRRLPCLGAVSRREVGGADDRNSISVRQEGV